MVKQMKEEEMRELDRERGQYKKDEAIQHFKALLSDLVCLSSITYGGEEY